MVREIKILTKKRTSTISCLDSPNFQDYNLNQSLYKVLSIIKK